MSEKAESGSQAVVERLLANRRYDFVMAMGDDTTDEDMFQALPAKAVTIKIGNVSKAANYNLPAQSDVLPFLQSMLRKQKNADRICSFCRVQIETSALTSCCALSVPSHASLSR